MNIINVLIIVVAMCIICQMIFQEQCEYLIILSKDKIEYTPPKQLITDYINTMTKPVVPYSRPKDKVADRNIPLNIYMVWHSKELPTMMKNNLEIAIKNNPEFKFFIYTIDDCRNFIKNNYSEIVLSAFDSLNPVAYKVDLFRYCILYTLGGIYLDIKFMPVNGFKFIDLVDKEYFTLERGGQFWKNNTFGICNAFIITKPYNEILSDCVENIIDNVNNKFYGYNVLYPTGPGLLGQIYLEHKKKYDDIELFFVGFPNNRYTIQYKNSIILQSYPEYQQERINDGKPTYIELYAKKNIYL